MKSIVKLNIKFCSAKTTYNILKQLEYDKLIDRFNHKSDKRVIMFAPSQITLIEFNNWAEQLKNSLNNVISQTEGTKKKNKHGQPIKIKK